MLSQVLGWGLLGGPSAVQQFSLQQGQIGLEKKRQGLEGSFPGVGPHTTGPSTSKGFCRQDDIRPKPFFPPQPDFPYASVSKATSVTLNGKDWLARLLPSQNLSSLKEENVLSSPLWPNTESNRAQYRFVEHNDFKTHAFLKTLVSYRINVPSWE